MSRLSYAPTLFQTTPVPPEIICYAIWLYAKFTLSFRDAEERLAERGLYISYETVRRWFLKLGSAIAANLRRARPRPSDYCQLNKMILVIRERRRWRCQSNANRPRGRCRYPLEEKIFDLPQG